LPLANPPPKELLDRAEAASQTRNWLKAQELWNQILAEYKPNDRTYSRLAEAQRNLGSIENAQQTIDEGIKLYPNYLALRIEAALLSSIANDWSRTIELWNEVLANFRETAPAGAWLRLSQAYRVQKRFTDAENTIVEALSKFPNRSELLIEAAYVATAKKDWLHASRRWAKASANGVTLSAEGYQKYSLALRQRRKLEQARKVISKGLSIYQEDNRLIAESAEIEAADENYTYALRLWEKTLKNLPVAAEGQRLNARFNISLIKRLVNFNDYLMQIENYNIQKTRKKPRIAIITSVTKGFELIKPHEVLDARFDYLIYSDANFNNLGFYQLCPMPRIDLDNARLSRYMKMHPYELAEIYDLVVWVDASMMIVGDLYPLFEKFMSSGKPIGANVHPLRKTIQEEYVACVALGKDDPATMRKQLNHYAMEGFDGRGLAECTILAFNLRDHAKEVKLAMDTWWEQLLRFSKRDQLSFPYSLWAHGLSWFPLTKPPHGIRNHAALILTSHNTDYPLLNKLYESIKDA
jgi:tetratricopeptide (TPR) repeat protein